MNLHQRLDVLEESPRLNMEPREKIEERLNARLGQIKERLGGSRPRC